MMEKILNYKKQLEELIDNGQELKILTMISRFHPDDIAELIDVLEEDKKSKLFRLLNIETASDVIMEIDDISRELILEDIPQERLTKIVDDMPSDDAADFIGDLPHEQAHEILSHIEREKSQEVQKLLEYPEDSAGGIMQTELICVEQHLTAKDAIEHIRSKSEEVEDIHNVFVTDHSRRLVGILPLEKLILAKENTPIANIMEPADIYVTVDLDQEEVAKVFKKYDIVSLPVVNNNHRLMGRILVDDVVDIIEQENSEDIFMMAGVSEQENIVYSSNILKISRKRLPWVVIYLFGTMCSGYLLWVFKHTLKEVLALITFVPVVTAMSGNVGVQTSSIVVRGLAIGKINFAGLRTLIIKELCVALLIGFCCGVIGATVASLWHHKAVLGVIVGFSIIISIISATLMGTLIPFFFKKLNIDPALASGPLVTTANDIVSIIIYFGLASIFLTFMLH